MKKLTLAVIAIFVIVFLVVAYSIFQYTVKKITEREVRRITQEEIGKITESQADSITKSEIERITGEITEQKTKEITNQMFGGDVKIESLKEVECDKTPSERKFAYASYYEGPLFDAHLHMPFTFEVPPALYQQADWDGPIMEKEVPMGRIICGFDKTKTSSAFGFYVVPSLLKTQSVQLIREIEEKRPGKIVPFIMHAHVSGLNLKPEEAEQILNSNEGLFKGYGEIVFYKGSYKGISPDDSSLLEIYKIADKNKLIVMLHPDDGQQQAIESILKQYPGVKFLFHGGQMWPWVEKIIGVYPNAYYSIDENLFHLPNDHIANIYGPEKEEFLSEFTDYFDKILKTNLEIWKPRIEKYPDYYLWGTDRAFDWHFDLDVGALLDEMSRSFIGHLDPDVQERFAYKNAENLVQEN